MTIADFIEKYRYEIPYSFDEFVRELNYYKGAFGNKGFNVEVKEKNVTVVEKESIKDFVCTSIEDALIKAYNAYLVSFYGLNVSKGE